MSFPYLGMGNAVSKNQGFVFNPPFMKRKRGEEEEDHPVVQHLLEYANILERMERRIQPIAYPDRVAHEDIDEIDGDIFQDLGVSLIQPPRKKARTNSYKNTGTQTYGSMWRDVGLQTDKTTNSMSRSTSVDSEIVQNISQPDSNIQVAPPPPPQIQPPPIQSEEGDDDTGKNSYDVMKDYTLKMIEMSRNLGFPSENSIVSSLHSTLANINIEKENEERNNYVPDEQERKEDFNHHQRGQNLSEFQHLLISPPTAIIFLNLIYI